MRAETKFGLQEVAYLALWGFLLGLGTTAIERHISILEVAYVFVASTAVAFGIAHFNGHVSKQS